jgi:hypothetical protein
LCNKIHDTRSKESKVYYDGANIEEHNILIYLFYVLQHVYSCVDLRSAPNYNPTFLFTKISQSTHDKMLEEVRHKNLAKVKKTAYNIPPVRQSKTISKKGDEASDNDSKKDSKKDINDEDTNNEDQEDATKKERSELSKDSSLNPFPAQTTQKK